MSVHPASTTDNAAASEPRLKLLVGEKDGAFACGVSVPIFRRLAAAGLLRPVKLPNVRRNLYRIADIERLIDELASVAS